MTAILRHLPPPLGSSIPLPAIITLSDLTTFGRDKSRVKVYLDSTRTRDLISRHHASIVREESTYYLEDKGSTNGTFVNDVKVGKQRVELRPQDRICFGSTAGARLPVGGVSQQPESEFCYRFEYADGLGGDSGKRIRTEYGGNDNVATPSTTSYPDDGERKRKLTDEERQRRAAAEKKEREEQEIAAARRIRDEVLEEERMKSEEKQREYETEREREKKDREERETARKLAEEEAKRRLEEEIANLAKQKAEHEQHRKEMEQEAQRRQAEIEKLRKEQEQLMLAAEQSKKQQATISALKDQLEEELMCCICQDLMVVPVTLACSHSFCEECIVDWLCTKRECPTCRQAFNNEIVSSVVLNNAIDKLLDQKENSAQDRADRETRKKQWMAKRDVEMAKVIQKKGPQPPPAAVRQPPLQAQPVFQPQQQPPPQTAAQLMNQVLLQQQQQAERQRLALQAHQQAQQQIRHAYEREQELARLVASVNRETAAQRKKRLQREALAAQTAVLQRERERVIREENARLQAQAEARMAEIQRQNAERNAQTLRAAADRTTLAERRKADYLAEVHALRAQPRTPSTTAATTTTRTATQTAPIVIGTPPTPPVTRAGTIRAPLPPTTTTSATATTARHPVVHIDDNDLGPLIYHINVCPSGAKVRCMSCLNWMRAGEIRIGESRGDRPVQYHHMGCYADLVNKNARPSTFLGFVGLTGPQRERVRERFPADR